MSLKFKKTLAPLFLIAALALTSSISIANDDKDDKQEAAEDKVEKDSNKKTAEMKTAEAISNCLNSWGKHPFGKNPEYKTLATSVKVFGIGKNPKDDEITKTPALILINPAVNVMGGTVYELLNPNGWYCFKSTVNVMGGMVIKADCSAHLASSSGEATVMGKNDDKNKGVTVMGSTKVELVNCK